MRQKTRLLLMSGWGNDRVFGDLFDSVLQHSEHTNIFQATLSSGDTLVLEGGTDINPNFYEQRKISWSQKPDVRRDAKEAAMFRKVVAAGGSVLGICRGAQFITALAGGELIQHVDGHCGQGIHSMLTHTGETIKTNSLHHQMMFPFGLPKEDYRILAHTPRPISTQYLIHDDSTEVDVKDSLPEDFVEPEIVWYPRVRGLGIQGHPEFAGWRSTERSGWGQPNLKPALEDFVVYCRNLVKEFILNDLPV